SYIAAAVRLTAVPHLHFITCDATAIPTAAEFHCAICLTNTWGTMSDKVGVLREMRRLAPAPGSRLLTLFSASSVAARREWYRRLGHTVVEETVEYLGSAEGFRSEHFSEDRLRSLVGDCVVRPLADIAYAVTF